eukprot:5242326-Pyramimonas_sp.AAC.1
MGNAALAPTSAPRSLAPRRGQKLPAPTVHQEPQLGPRDSVPIVGGMPEGEVRGPPVVAELPGPPAEAAGRGITAEAP